MIATYTIPDIVDYDGDVVLVDEPLRFLFQVCVYNIKTKEYQKTLGYSSKYEDTLDMVESYNSTHNTLHNHAGTSVIYVYQGVVINTPLGDRLSTTTTVKKLIKGKVINGWRGEPYKGEIWEMDKGKLTTVEKKGLKKYSI